MLRMTAAAIMLALSLSGGMSYSEDIMAEQLELSGACELEDQLPEDTAGLLDRLGIEPDIGGTAEFAPEDALESITKIAAEQSKAPLSACLAALALSVVCALGASAAERTGALGSSYGTLSACAAALMVCVPAAGFIDSAADAVASVCSFSAALVPVLSGLAYISGRTASAAAYSGLTLAVIEGITVVSSSVIVPVLRILLGISAVGALCPSFDLSRLICAVEKSAKWLLGIMGTVLSGVMGMSAVAASAADTAAVKGTRFIISGAVPVVGGAISDAIGTITNCVAIVRSSVGSFGIIALLFILLPPAVLAVLWMGGLSFVSWAANALGAERPAAAMRSLGSVVSLTLGLMAFTAVVLTCSAGLIIAIRSS